MAQSKQERLSGWGQVPAAECKTYRPEKRRELPPLVTGASPLIARGYGRSYGDASLNPEGVLHIRRLDHFLGFDAKSGVLRAQAGVSLSDILSVCVPLGWILPVVPGTRHVTLGGAVASNVHGKNQFREGDFCEHVLGLRLMLATGESVECSPSQHSELFWATAGGMGMTGVIEEVTLQLKRIASSSLKTLTYRVDSIEDMLAGFEHYRDGADYMVGWIDHMAKGEDLGRGVFEAANHISAEEGGEPLGPPLRHKRSVMVPFNMPPFLLNRYVMALYNRWRFKRVGFDRATETVGFDGFFHPLDAIGNWNRLYGRRGFFQYQCLLPNSPDISLHLRRLLALIHQKKCFSFLAVLKYHRDGKGMLTFSKHGYSLALDFPNNAAVRALLPQLDQYVAERGGRVYLAKDAHLMPESFAQMYGQQAAEWQSFIRELDPEARFTSLMSERLQWK